MVGFAPIPGVAPKVTRRRSDCLSSRGTHQDAADAAGVAGPEEVSAGARGSDLVVTRIGAIRRNR